MRTRVESRIHNGTIQFRMSCDRCPRHGAWLTNVYDADNSASIHDKAHEREKGAD